VGEKVELKEGKCKVVEVSHQFSVFASEARGGCYRREAPAYSGTVRLSFAGEAERILTLNFLAER
jgi:hypothetical protein